MKFLNIFCAILVFAASFGRSTAQTGHDVQPLYCAPEYNADIVNRDNDYKRHAGGFAESLKRINANIDRDLFEKLPNRQWLSENSNNQILNFREDAIRSRGNLAATSQSLTGIDLVICMYNIVLVQRGVLKPTVESDGAAFAAGFDKGKSEELQRNSKIAADHAKFLQSQEQLKQRASAEARAQEKQDWAEVGNILGTVAAIGRINRTGSGQPVQASGSDGTIQQGVGQNYQPPAGWGVNVTNTNRQNSSQINSPSQVAASRSAQSSSHSHWDPSYNRTACITTRDKPSGRFQGVSVDWLNTCSETLYIEECGINSPVWECSLRGSGDFASYGAALGTLKPGGTSYTSIPDGYTRVFFACKYPAHPHITNVNPPAGRCWVD